MNVSLPVGSRGNALSQRACPLLALSGALIVHFALLTAPPIGWLTFPQYPSYPELAVVLIPPDPPPPPIPELPTPEASPVVELPTPEVSSVPELPEPEVLHLPELPATKIVPPAKQGVRHPVASSPPPIKSVKPQQQNKLPSADQLVTSSLTTTPLLPPLPQGERRKAISSRTQDYKYAFYLDTWRKKVLQETDNWSFPKDKYYGRLVMEVTLEASGVVRDILVRQSSGYPDLDQIAQRIVRRASPFAPFPPTIRQETDVLLIVLDWGRLKAQ